MEGIEGFQTHSTMYNHVERRVVDLERSLTGERNAVKGEEITSLTLFQSLDVLWFSFSLF